MSEDEGGRSRSQERRRKDRDRAGKTAAPPASSTNLAEALGTALASYGVATKNDVTALQKDLASFKLEQESTNKKVSDRVGDLEDHNKTLRDELAALRESVEEFKTIGKQLSQDRPHLPHDSPPSEPSSFRRLHVDVKGFAPRGQHAKQLSAAEYNDYAKKLLQHVPTVITDKVRVKPAFAFNWQVSFRCESEEVAYRLQGFLRQAIEHKGLSIKGCHDIWAQLEPTPQRRARVKSFLQHVGPNEGVLAGTTTICRKSLKVFENASRDILGQVDKDGVFKWDLQVCGTHSIVVVPPLA